jgi:hypothetical protein
MVWDGEVVGVPVGDVGRMSMGCGICRVWSKRTSVVSECTNGCKTSGETISHVWKSKRSRGDAKDGG